MRKISTAAIVGALAVPAAASASGAAPNGGVLAQYQGRTINLAESWEGARACVQYAVGDVRCYASSSEAEKDSLVRAARMPAGEAAALSCAGGGSVTLYPDIGFGGSWLRFTSTAGSWTNLAFYGFNDDMESWDNSTDCDAKVADGINGSGDQLVLASGSSSSNVGATWKNRASSFQAQ